MKKIILFTALAAMFSTPFISCKKESTSPPLPTLPPPPQIQSGAVAKLLTDKTSSQVVNGRSTYRISLTFKTTVKGNIKSLKLNLPAPASNVLTTLRQDNSIVASAILTCSNINSWDNSVAVDIPIEANTEYILSINSNSFYSATFAAGIFPFIHESIILLNYTRTYISDPRRSPAIEAATDKAYGFVDFTFQKTE